MLNHLNPYHQAWPPFDGVGHPSPYRGAADVSAAYQHQHTGHHNHHHGRNRNDRMAGSSYMPSDEEYAQLQKLSNEFEASATVPQGPLVGERQSSSAITTEYANADHVYRIKTRALPSKYAFFRTCRGDGHCGWRAIAFTYYEGLLRGGDANKFEDEEVRLQSMRNLLINAGFPEHTYEEFAEETYDLMKQLATSMRAMDDRASSILLQAFNDPSTSMAIITHFKLLASAWIQSHPDDFLPFLLDYPNLKVYCQHNIEPANCEIDHPAMAALAEAVVKPAGLGLEVLYLDRSPGEEINNTFRIEPTGHDGYPIVNAPTMRLLYRPGHYDILYKAEDFPPPVPSQAPLHVALAGYTDEFVPMASNMSDVMTLIPGMYPTGIGQRWPSVPYDYNQSPAPQPQVTPVPTYAPAPTTAAPVASSHQEYVSPVHSNHVTHHDLSSHHSIRLEPPITLPIHPPPAPPPLAIESRPPMTIERGGPFRPSMYELEPGFASGQVHALPFQTSIFRNSHYNTAHFLNPDFQPEEWSPDSEYATGNRGRHKSTSQ